MAIEKKASIEELAALFGVLADPTRLKLLKLLVQQQEASALCVNALARRLGVTQSAVSQHLRVLKSEGLVKGERRGYRVHYFINQQTLARAQGKVLAAFDFEGGESEDTPREKRDDGD